MQSQLDTQICTSSPAEPIAYPEMVAQLLLNEAHSAQSRLAAALSHELNSPIGALNSALETMSLILKKQQERPQRAGELREYLFSVKQVAEDCCQRLIDIAARMRRLTNLNRAELRPVDVNELLTDAIAFLKPELDDKANVVLDLGPLRPLNCAPRQLGTVFCDLIRNAVAHLEEKGEIQMSSRDNGDEILIEIGDNGRGIATARLPTLFEVGFEVKGGKVVTGNWSLFASRNVILEHGGHIDINSAEGQGTKVIIRLPYKATRTPNTNFTGDETMASNPSAEPVKNESVVYCGLPVQVIARLPNCSLIRYADQERVVETADLQRSLTRRQAA